MDRCVLARTASTAALLAWTLARGLLRFAGAVEIAVRRLDLAFGMMTICNPKTKRKGNAAYGKTNLKLDEQKGKAGKKFFFENNLAGTKPCQDTKPTRWLTLDARKETQSQHNYICLATKEES